MFSASAKEVRKVLKTHRQHNKDDIREVQGNQCAMRMTSLSADEVPGWDNSYQK